ncbi:hypothetical protein NDU88_005365 [Pleurodeles waltl]|uniref:Uncharacterized protein n=1 Tax=Pleurodeles waltl TaxID=8319 RepID=A0AAV7UJS0_PLEWA|nr:hypothetical protein NDU88_005365 [Pleurodeles waltl]
MQSTRCLGRLRFEKKMYCSVPLEHHCEQLPLVANVGIGGYSSYQGYPEADFMLGALGSSKAAATASTPLSTMQ